MSSHRWTETLFASVRCSVRLLYERSAFFVVDRLAGAFDAEHRKQFHFSFDKVRSEGVKAVNFDIARSPLGPCVHLLSHSDEALNRLVPLSIGQDHELVNLRAVVESRPASIECVAIAQGDPDPSKAK
jgi:hypothetical protein